jgi:hypothetical protein
VDIQDDLGGGLFASFLMSFPIGFLDLQLAFDNSLLGFLFFPFLPYILPYMAFVVVGVVLYRLKRPRMGKGMLIGGVIFSTLIVIGIVLFEMALLSSIGR